MIAESTEDIARRAECAQIDDVLAALAARIEPDAWLLVERAMRLTISLYSTGLERTLGHARAANADATLDSRLAADDLVGKLLALHGLHPHTPAQRIDSALATLRAALGVADRDLEVAAFADGRLRIHATPAIAGVEEHICRALEETVPELQEIEIVGAAAAAA